MTEGKFFEIRSQLSQYVLSLVDDAAEPGQRVNLQASEGRLGQLWWEDTRSGRIRSAKNDHLVLEIEEDHLIVNHNDPEAYNQKWRLAGEYIRHLDDSDMVLDVPYSRTDEFTDIQMYEFEGNDNQQWAIDYKERRFCFIRSLMNGKVVDIRRACPDPDVEICMWDMHDEAPPNQLWWEDKHGNIRSKLNEFVFFVRRPGNAMFMKEFDAENIKGLWAISGKTIYNKETGHVLSIQGGKGGNGAKICMLDNNGNDNQQWELVYV